MKASLSSKKPFPFLAIAVLASMSVAGCSSGPDIKPPPPAPVPQAEAPSAQAAELQTSLAAMDRSLVEQWQALAETQRLVADLARPCNGGGQSDMTQLEQQNLEQQLQKQQQILQTMSQVSKMLRDTTEAIVRKTGG